MAPTPRPLTAGARTAAVLSALLGVNGLWGGGSLVARPDGALLQLDPALLAHSPFADYLVPGLVLLAVNGLLPLAVTALWWRRHPVAPQATVLSGVLLSGWIAVQVALLRTFMPTLHVPFFTLGVALALLGWREGRRGAAT